jgi:type VI secretion system protein ImpB
VAKQSSQKFIARNRAPRVQIEYDVEVYGSQKKVQLPFVMGVMSDLSGKSATPLPPVADRKFLEIDIDNFDQRLKAMMPRVAFAVPNTLTGEGNLQVDLTFESMDDFSPAAIAKKVEPLRKLLETRTQLSNLMTYMDGKSGAEELVGKMLRDPALLQTLGSTPKPAAAAVAAQEEEKPSEENPSEENPPGGEDDKENLDSLLDEMK